MRIQLQPIFYFTRTLSFRVHVKLWYRIVLYFFISNLYRMRNFTPMLFENFQKHDNLKSKSAD